MTADTAVFNHNLTEWLVEYNFRRPHQSLGYLPPISFTFKYHKVCYRCTRLVQCVDTIPVFAIVERKSTIIPNFSYPMSRHTSTMTISLPKHLKAFVKERSLTAHYGTPSDYIRGLIREDLKRLEQERLEQELLKGIRSGQGIPMTKQTWKRLRAEAAKRNQAKR
jgi:antitoxin ParD1/3/4